MEQAFEYSLSCSNCGRAASGWQGQELYGDSDRIRWFAEWQCPSCGLVSDDYGDGPGPDSLRQALIDRFGGSTIAVPTRDIRLVVMKKLREMFGLSPTEALAMLTESGPDHPIGTTIEVQAIVRAIQELGYRSEVMQTAPAGDSGNR